MQGIIYCFVSSLITVVDDGSGLKETQRMQDEVKKIQEEYPQLINKMLSLPKNSGKGHAICRGWNETMRYHPTLLCFVDADGSVPAWEVRKLVDALRAEKSAWDALFGCRLRILGKKNKRLLHRHLMGRIFTTSVTLLTKIKAYDTQCGLKVLRQETYQAIKNSLKENGYVFDVELTLRLLQEDYKVLEIPIDWKEMPKGKVHPLKDGVIMLFSLWRIRRNHGVLKEKHLD